MGLISSLLAGECRDFPDEGDVPPLHIAVHCTVERVVVSQNEFWDSALVYFNVFFNIGVGSFSSTFGFGQFLWGKMGFQNSYFAIKVKISKCPKLLSDNFNI